MARRRLSPTSPRTEPKGDRNCVCFVCGRVRPEGLIGVHSRDMTTPTMRAEGAELYHNMRYCLDDPVCAIKVRSLRLEFGTEMDGPMIRQIPRGVH